MRWAGWSSGASPGGSLPEDAGLEQSLGLWCERVGGLLEQTLDVALAHHGLRRRHWQVLDALGPATLTRAQIAEAMLPFWVAAAVTQTDVVDDLVRRDWAETDGSSYWLTSAGRAAHERITAAVAQLQADSLRGIPEADRRVALEVLARVAANLSP